MYQGNIMAISLVKEATLFGKTFYVTGSSDGTLSEPKCSLKKILKESTFPSEELAQKRGEFEYT